MDFLKRHIAWVVAFALALGIVGAYRGLFAAPADFPEENSLAIERGTSALFVARALAEARVIAHPSVLLFLLRVSGTSDNIQTGRYRFETRENVFTIANRLVTGAYGFPPVLITFTEGTTVREMAADLAEALPQISAEDFLSAGLPYEGYLFPDTYLFFPSSDAGSIVAAMRANFNTKITTLSREIEVSGHTLPDLVIVASLVEKEARTIENKRIVAGILSNRLELGMPLQVDAVFGYIFGRDTYSPSFEDLKVNSPYNTYLHVGLPPGPITNPGLDSLQAAAVPTKTDYLYYLTGSDNLMHYATTYVGHLANQNKYLR